MGKKLDEPTIGTTIRLPERVIDLLEDYRQRLLARTPGINVSMSDAARVAMLRGLAADEGDE